MLNQDIRIKVKSSGRFFPIKDKISWKHESDLVYHYGCNVSINYNCISVSNYVGETNMRIGTRTYEHYTDRNSAVFRHGEIAKHVVDDSNFKNFARAWVWKT